MALKHVARALVSRYVDRWRRAVRRRLEAAQHNVAALRLWARARRRTAWRAWRRVVCLEHAVVSSAARRREARLARSLVWWAEQTPFAHTPRLGRAGRSPPSLVEWAFAAKYRTTRRLAMAMDTWATYLRRRRRLALLEAKAWQHNQHAALARAIRSWQTSLADSRLKRQARCRLRASRLSLALRAWAQVHQHSQAAAEGRIRVLAMSRMARHVRRWQVNVDAQRLAATADRCFNARLGATAVGEWRRVTHLSKALRAMDEVAVGVALRRIAQKHIDGWLEWRSIQLQKNEVVNIANAHHSASLTSWAIRRWRGFVEFCNRRTRLKRQARHHRRSRRLRGAYSVWLRYLAWVDEEYGALQRALLHCQRSVARAALAGWQKFRKASQTRRLQMLHAEGHREAALMDMALSGWQAGVTVVRSRRDQDCEARRHYRLCLQRTVLHGLRQATQLSATLRWAKESRLASLRATLAISRQRRVWGLWAVDLLAAARLKAAARLRADIHRRSHRLRSAMAALAAFLAQRRWTNRKLAAALNLVRVTAVFGPPAWKDC